MGRSFCRLLCKGAATLEKFGTSLWIKLRRLKKDLTSVFFVWLLSSHTAAVFASSSSSRPKCMMCPGIVHLFCKKGALLQLKSDSFVSEQGQYLSNMRYGHVSVLRIDHDVIKVHEF